MRQRALRAPTSKPCALLDSSPVQHLDWKKACIHALILHIRYIIHM